MRNDSYFGPSDAHLVIISGGLGVKINFPVFSVSVFDAMLSLYCSASGHLSLVHHVVGFGHTKTESPPNLV